MTHRFNVFMLALIVLVGLPVYVLLFDNPGSSAAPKPLTIAELRAAAALFPGEAPGEPETEVAASRRLPQALFAAGSGFQLRRSLIKAYRLPVPGGKPIVIDSGLTPAHAAELGMFFNPGAQARIDRAMMKAGLILLTHEHADHIGGLAALAAAEPALMNTAKLSPAQAASSGLEGAGAVAGGHPPYRKPFRARAAASCPRSRRDPGPQPHAGLADDLCAHCQRPRVSVSR